MQVQVISEREQGTGWQFTVTWGDHTCDLSLSWADYNFWSPDGTHRPAFVARAVAVVMLEHGPSGVPNRFDASILRRLIDAGDQLVQRQLRSDLPRAFDA